MSKYIKLEDAIEQVKTEFYGGGYQEWLEISIDNLINRIANLPTTEVSEDCKSRAVYITNLKEAYMKGHEDGAKRLRQAYMKGYEDGRKSVEVSEDCISREQFREQMYHRCFEVDNDPNMQKWDSGNWLRWKLFEEELENAPSVVPRLDKEDLEDIKEHISESYIEGYMDGHAEGEWISQEQGAFYPVECSNCHKEPLLNEDEDYEYTKYCPYCGSRNRKMKV